MVHDIFGIHTLKIKQELEAFSVHTVYDHIFPSQKTNIAEAFKYLQWYWIHHEKDAFQTVKHLLISGSM